jgi:formylglycine-generating enzyme required for sulfatase activity
MTLNEWDANFDLIKRRGLVDSGVFPANRWGLHDMHGNIWEFCGDWYESSYYRTFAASYRPSRNPVGPKKGNYSKVVRGGSFMLDADQCRSSFRTFRDCRATYENVGFRFVLSIRDLQQRPWVPDSID